VIMGKVFGEVPGYPIGSTWQSREELSDSKVHAPPMGGISGTAAKGADSIVVNGGYEDDLDHESVIIYTGAGENDPSKKVQITDQTLENAGKKDRLENKLHSMVCRGAITLATAQSVFKTNWISGYSKYVG